ncbi:MAG: type II toxin-antitoxin system RelE family toxin [Jiangellaceae bacterium]
MNDPYDVILSPSARRALTETLPEKVATAVLELIDGALRENPHRLGKPLHDAFAGQFVARRSTYRVIYTIDDEAHVITIRVVKARGDAYHPSGTWRRPTGRLSSGWQTRWVSTAMRWSA